MFSEAIYGVFLVGWGLLFLLDSPHQCLAIPSFACVYVYVFVYLEKQVIAGTPYFCCSTE